MRSIIIILSFFALGVTTALLVDLSLVLNSGNLSTWMLYLLIFTAGLSIGVDDSFSKLFRNISIPFIIFPFIVLLGSILGSVVVSMIMPQYSLSDWLAVGSGMGYYSLSSVLILEARGQELGTIALLSNLIREIITLLCAPFIVKYISPLAPIASGGATSMDTTLPVVVQFSGKEYAMLSIYSGMMLTLLVPIMVSLFL